MTTKPVTPTPLPPLKATLPKLLYDFCLAHGILAETLERQWGVPAHAVSDPDAWVPYELGLALWDALIASGAEPAAGVAFGRHVGFLDLGIVGLAASHAATVEQAFATFAPLRHLVDPALELELLQENGQRVLVCASHPALAQRIHPMEAMLVSTNTALQRLTQLDLLPLRVEFAHTPLAALENYRALFGCVPEVTARYALTYPEAVWQTPIAGSHPLVLKYLVAHSRSQPEPPRVASSFTARVQQWLRAQCQRVPPQPVMSLHVAAAARELGASRRDLQRRLATEGTTFRKLQDQLARELAHSLLQEPGRSIAQVAYALGYAEPRSFQRACYRWFQAGPGAHRSKPKT